MLTIILQKILKLNAAFPANVEISCGAFLPKHEDVFKKTGFRGNYCQISLKIDKNATIQQQLSSQKFAHGL